MSGKKMKEKITPDTRVQQKETVSGSGCTVKADRHGQLDLTGMRFGRLTCLSLTGERDRQGKRQWLCRCDCGNTCLTSASQLRAGYKKSCGCLGHPPLKDLTGRRFSGLTVAAYAGKTGGMHRWKCRCDCGNETVVGQTLLLSGKTGSCGCRRKKRIVENMKFVGGTSVTLLETRRYRPPASSNSSGHTGVYRNRKNDKWTAQIGFRGKNYYLGSFDKIEDAVRIRQQAEKKMYEPFIEWYYGTRPQEPYSCGSKGREHRTAAS